jgi:hypothetical protein
MSKVERENKPSEKGMSKAKSGAGGSTAKHDEYVGSTGTGIRFKMPTDVTDHSKVRSQLKE